MPNATKPLYCHANAMILGAFFVKEDDLQPS